MQCKVVLGSRFFGKKYILFAPYLQMIYMIHEERSKLSEKTLDLKRAIDSLKEELEAVDWYNQRVDACTDENLKKILVHNANEEKEHAAMLIEWLRQNDDDFAKEIKEYLFSTEKDIASLEEG